MTNRLQRRASDAQRRAEEARFKRLAASGGFVSSLVAADDPRLAADRLLSGAVRHWLASPRKKTCFNCAFVFTETTPAAYLLVRAAHTSTVATAALCEPCWSTADEADLIAEATRALRPVLGGAAP